MLRQTDIRKGNFLNPKSLTNVWIMNHAQNINIFFLFFPALSYTEKKNNLDSIFLSVKADLSMRKKERNEEERNEM